MAISLSDIESINGSSLSAGRSTKSLSAYAYHRTYCIKPDTFLPWLTAAVLIYDFCYVQDFVETSSNEVTAYRYGSDQVPGKL